MNEYLKERRLWWPVSPELVASYCDGSHTKTANGTMVWYKDGQLHRDDDKPAVIFADGRLRWYKNGEFHRVTGPAVINSNNKHEYWINGVNITKEVESWLATRQYTYPFTPEQQTEFTRTFG